MFAEICRSDLNMNAEIVGGGGGAWNKRNLLYLTLIPGKLARRAAGLTCQECFRIVST